MTRPSHSFCTARRAVQHRPVRGEQNLRHRRQEHATAILFEQIVQQPVVLETFYVIICPPNDARPPKLENSGSTR